MYTALRPLAFASKRGLAHLYFSWVPHLGSVQVVSSTRIISLAAAMGLTGSTAALPGLRALAGATVLEEGERKEGGDLTGKESNTSEQEGCRQSPQFIDPIAKASLSACPSSLLHAAVQSSRIPTLFGAPKRDSVDLLKPLFFWLFPNLLVALVFAVTLTACLLCDATIEFDLCFLLLLIASWALLAAAASRKATQGPQGERRGTLGGAPKTLASCQDTKKVSGGEAEGAQAQPLTSPAALDEPRSAATGDEGCRPIFYEERCPPAGQVLGRKWSLGAPDHSSSIISLETTTSWNDYPRFSASESLGASDDGASEEATRQIAELQHQGARDGVHEADEEDACVFNSPLAAEEVTVAAKAPQESQADSAAEAAAPTSQDSTEDLFPLFRDEEAAETAEERERTLNEMEGAEETEDSRSEGEDERDERDWEVSAFVAGARGSNNSTNTDFSAWLGALGEVTLSSSIADLSFCRSQTLAAASLSPHEQSMSLELEGPPFPELPLSSVAEEADSKGTSTAPPSELQPSGPPFGAAPSEQQRSSQQTGFSTSMPEEAVITRGSDGASLDCLLEQQLQQQQPLLLQQLHQHASATRSRPPPAAASPGMPPRRAGGPRRKGGLPMSGKMQKRENRAALQYYMGLVKDCCKRRDGAGALRVLEEVQREGRVAPDVQLLNYVLFACVASQDAFLTKRLFEFIEGAGVADIVTYNTMLKSFSLSGQLEEAEKILRRMRGRSVPPDEVSFNLLVNAAVCCGRIDRAWHYVDELKTAHMVPDKFTISSLVKSLQPGQNPKLIQRTLRLMDGVDVCEDLILLSTCIDATLRLGDMERLRRLLDRFENSSLSPNAHAYGTLIKAYGRLGNLSRVWALWSDLQNKKNMEPTNYTYGCMLDILLSNNLLADATQLFCKMVQQGVVDAVHFSILVKGLSKYNDQGVRLALEAYSVLQSSTAFRRGGVGGGKGVRGRGEGEKSQSQLALNTISFNALLHLCVVNGRMADALRLFHDMERQDTVAPDLISYSTVIKGLCCCPGDAPLERALSLLDQMQKRYGIRPDAIVFNTLIQGAATRKNPALVEHLLKLMQQSNVPPSSYTLCQCVKLYGKCNNLQRALELANELPSRFGFSVDGYVYTALIAACVSNGAAVLAGQLALQATSSGIEIPHGVLCRLWNTLHLARTTQQDSTAHAELSSVYDAIWRLLGPQSKDPSTIGPEGIGVRRSRRRGGKQHGNNSSRPKAQSGTNSNHLGSGVTTLAQERHVIPQGAISSFVSTVQRDWEGIPDSPIMERAGIQPEMEAAALWRDTNTANAGFPW